MNINLNAQPGAHLRAPDIKTRFIASHLDIGYKGERIVADISCKLEAGEALALVGVNGSGKSTLLKTIVGLIPPQAGELLVLGERPTESSNKIAYLSQFHSSGFILPLRAIDIVRMGRFPERGLFSRMTLKDEALVHSAMVRMGVEDLADASLRSLSGGQQQRIYLAQALARQANLLVLDEPTSGLDAVGKELYSQAMRQEMERGATIISATHDIQEAAMCCQVMLLARRVVALGPGPEVLTPNRLLETFGIVISGDRERLAVIEREHGHDHSELGHSHSNQNHNS
jgi:ABC-type Mn2+/Zn2+ transport system ATPase subunit